MDNKQRLVEGPIFKSQFVQYKWLAFRDDNGKDCFETHTLNQIINTIVRQNPQRSIEYAEIIQNGTWD